MTDLNAVNFEAIETGIKDRIRAEVPDFKTVETYSGVPLDSLDGLMLPLPAALVLFEGESYTPADVVTVGQEARFSVFVVASSFKGSETLREGAYGLVRAVLSALTYQTLDLEIERLRPVSTELVLATQTAAIYQVRFATQYDAEFEA